MVHSVLLWKELQMPGTKSKTSDFLSEPGKAPRRQQQPTSRILQLTLPLAFVMA